MFEKLLSPGKNEDYEDFDDFESGFEKAMMANTFAQLIVETLKKPRHYPRRIF